MGRGGSWAKRGDSNLGRAEPAPSAAGGAGSRLSCQSFPHQRWEAGDGIQGSHKAGNPSGCCSTQETTCK